MLWDPVIWLFVLATGLLIVAVFGVIFATRQARPREQASEAGSVNQLAHELTFVHDLRGRDRPAPPGERPARSGAR